MTSSGTEFLQRSVASTLVSPESLESVQRRRGRQWPEAADECAAWLVDSGLLTPYQAEELQAGRGERLLRGFYVILEPLGFGGMGVVYKARHRKMDRVVALKVLASHIRGTAAAGAGAGAGEADDAVRRFQRETLAAARLHHPNIVTAFDAGEAFGEDFLVMEYVAGEDLSTYVRRRGPLGAHEALDLCIQGAQGLAFAHDAGIVHRDIKPSNLMRTEQGQVKILDLGLARFGAGGDEAGGRGTGADQSSRSLITESGRVMGTADFMAPEQARDARSADRRSDVYSLGATLWFLFTGQVVYPAESLVSTLLAHQTEPIPSLRDLRPDLAPQFDALLARLLAKRPEERPADMGELIRDLERVRGGLPESADRGSAGGVLPTRPKELEATVITDGDSAPSESSPAPQEARPAVPRTIRWDGGHSVGSLADAATQVRPRDLERGRLFQRWRAMSAASRRWRFRIAGVLLLALLVGLGALLAAPVYREVSSGERPRVLPASVVWPFHEFEAASGQRRWERALRGVAGPEWTQSQIAFKLIPPGTFRMGSPEDEPGRIADEGPVTVTISRPFWMAEREVTRAQWRLIMATAPWLKLENGQTAEPAESEPGSEDRPAVGMTWQEANEFCRRLTQFEAITEVEFRLPTEAEWEWSCRALTTGRFAYGELTWGAEFPTEPSSDEPPAEGSAPAAPPVPLSLPNAFGLRAMHSGVKEWCLDAYSQALPGGTDPQPVGDSASVDRVTRGGTSDIATPDGRSAARDHYDPALRLSTVGLRPVAAPTRGGGSSHGGQ